MPPVHISLLQRTENRRIIGIHRKTTYMIIHGWMTPTEHNDREQFVDKRRNHEEYEELFMYS